MEQRNDIYSDAGAMPRPGSEGRHRYGSIDGIEKHIEEGRRELQDPKY